ncbi:ExbD/TolR family protein [Kangiella sediminilitoris]|uniref:Biopolymer transporter ExbD n=1 Tax=Kangiella sediminilitoris TaxID=1144748 RepID=A0A1B3BAS7_9GAMM|nr:biopolymer transporter ExbD [Kangiella sediminilitoris]AOE49876.1 biopolymer transporter ExbD [Kangiella sediminilitoris]
MWLKKKKEDIQINLTPLIDVVFLLLIFFMVSTSFKKETKVSLELPEASGEMMDSKPNTIEVRITKAGEIYIDGKGLVNRKVETIKAAIKESSTDTKTPVIISADAQAPYQSVITVMDAAGQAGFNNLTLPTQKPQPEK